MRLPWTGNVPGAIEKECIMRDCPYLYVIMCEDTGEAGMHPGVSAVFESRDRADEYVARCQDNQSQLRYYIDTSFLDGFED